MSRLSANAERRAAASTTPAERETIDRVLAPPPLAPPQMPEKATATSVARVGEVSLSTLTAREDKVRRILLQDLGIAGLPLADTDAGTLLSAQLDVDHLHSVVADMKRELRTWAGVRPWLIGLGIVGVGGLVWAGGAMLVAVLPLAALSFTMNRRTVALRRKQYIYEALLALSDAYDPDATLERTIATTDDLIAEVSLRVLERES
jgi:hypothetical protein